MTMLRWAAAMWLMGAGMVLGQQQPQGIHVTGQGIATARPDMARITLGVTQRKPTAKEAMDAVNQSVASILDGVKKAGIPEESLQTSRFYLYPLRDNTRYGDSNNLKTRGYEAGNSITIEVRDLGKLGAVLDTALELGANDFNGLDFGIKDTASLLADARKKAVEDGRKRAEQIAAAAGVKLGPIVHINEMSDSGPMYSAEMSAMRSSASDAVAGGEVDVSARVNMIFGIAAGE